MTQRLFSLIKLQLIMINKKKNFVALKMFEDSILYIQANVIKK